jgi:hypothetical protein
LAALLLLWLRFGERLWRPPFDRQPPIGRLVEAAEEGLEDLRQEPNPRTAIIKCEYNPATQSARESRPPPADRSASAARK